MLLTMDQRSGWLQKLAGMSAALMPSSGCRQNTEKLSAPGRGRRALPTFKIMLKTAMK